MDIRHLRTFVTVARLGSVTRAAEALHITQPAVSGQLKTLEETLELKLLDRTTTSITLTQAGTDLLRRAERAIEAFGDFVHAARSFRGQVAGAVRLGLPMLEPDAIRVGAFMQRMVERHPAVKMDLRMGRTATLRDGLRGAELDASIYVCQAIPRDMTGFVLHEAPYRMVAPAAWRDKVEGAPWADIARLPFIRVTPGSAHGEILAAMLGEAGIRPAQTVEADHELLIQSLAAAGVGIGLLREDLALRAAAQGQLFVLDRPRASTLFCFIYPPDREGDPVIAAMAAVLKDIWGQVKTGAGAP